MPQTKRCTVCLDVKDEEEFNFRNKNRGKRLSRCAICLQKIYRERYQGDRHKKNAKERRSDTKNKRRLKLLEHLKELACIDCGESDPVVLDFDHVRGEKKFAISYMIRFGYSWERVKEEIDKCEIRCANCHRRVTAKRGGWWKHASSVAVVTMGMSL